MLEFECTKEDKESERKIKQARLDKTNRLIKHVSNLEEIANQKKLDVVRNSARNELTKLRKILEELDEDRTMDVEKFAQ